ncbi:hypothetical protein OJF2_09620 [Aquisphaera giovannonii]|uniref:Uncharacterized protein n=1 Tax=Aquisphaera giovannonii TaxID=406548 RepID=A0A5B9VXI7_9BACT|nr:hypothetical protein [Aquisphaera giovannonii]QEH32485.1 hypothetical protein OJF2_09620 [Aquisphaera giovannonii]
MKKTVIVRDETPTGEILNERVLTFDADQLTVGDLLRELAHAEARDFNEDPGSTTIHGLIGPETPGASAGDHASASPPAPPVRPQPLLDRTTQAFDLGHYLLLLDDTRVERLDHEFLIDRGTLARVIWMTVLDRP